MGTTVFEAGIDEAGYAPRLGPLVVTAVRVLRPASSKDLYELLGDCIARRGPLGRGDDVGPRRRLVVGDSKVLYSRGGLPALERGALPFCHLAARDRPTTDLGLAHALAGGTLDLEGLRWYEGDASPLPLEADAGELRHATARLSTSLEAAGVAGLAIRSRVVTARDLNRAVGPEANKADVLCGIVSALLAELVPEAGCGSVVVDRLGGRKFYDPLLARTWPGATVVERVEGAEDSRYVVDRPAPAPARCSVEFACRAEHRSMLVALASMVSKYVRELFMRRLNAWFALRLPDLDPTAGYPQDAGRFLALTEGVRRSAGIDDAWFVRSR